MQKSFKLNDGNSIPSVGLGTWKSQPNEVGAAIKYAIEKAGYTHIDGASIYRNEPEIGAVYKQVFNTFKRDSVFITSKLWNTSHNPKNVELACKQTLSDLQLDYLDLYLMHWGIAFKPGGDLEPKGEDGKVVTENVSVRQTWEAIENLVKKGLVRSIGVANFTTPMVVDLLTYAKIKPVNNQVEIHPYNTQSELVKYCQEKGIVITAYSPLGRQGVATVTGPRLFSDPLIQEMAEKYGRSASQILVNWALARGTVVIPKSVTPERIRENIQVYDFDLSSEDVSKVESLNKNLHFVDPGEWWGIPYLK